MNEININIQYSRFSDIFGCYFYVRMNSGLSIPVKRAIDDAKKYWLLFDSELRSCIIRMSETANYPRAVQNYVNHFIEWANNQFNAPQDYNSPRPLVDVLPVVDLKPYKGDKKC